MIGSRSGFPRNPRKYQGGWIQLAIAGVSTLSGALGSRKADKAARRAEAREHQLQQDQLRLAARQEARADEIHGHYRDVYMPRERELVSDVFNNPISADEEEAKATGDVRSAFGSARLADEQRMRGMGVNPASGSYRSLALARGLEEAKFEGAARTRARGNVRDLNFARQAHVLGMGTPTASVPHAGMAADGLGVVTTAAGAHAREARGYAATAGESFGESLTDLASSGLQWWDKRRQQTGEE